MSKNVLVIYYSQSGQLGEIVENLTMPIIQAGHQVLLAGVGGGFTWGAILLEV